MTKEAEGKAQQSNVIYFRPKRAAFKLPVEPSREDLAFDWTLSDADKGRAFDHREDDNRLRYAVQLCVLRKYGRFLNRCTEVPGNVLGYLCTQLEMAPGSELSGHPRQATESQYRSDICLYLAPRLQSLHKRRLFKIDRNHHYGALEPLFKGTVNLELFREQWEPLIRVAASLKNRIVPADVIVNGMYDFAYRRRRPMQVQ